MIKSMIGIFTLTMVTLGGAFFYDHINTLDTDNTNKNQQSSFLGLAIIVWVITLIFLCIVYCSW
jgi:Plasma-membrane choline transporter